MASGLAMGAKLVHPDKLCINVWGDAAIGFTGMDFEAAVRERIPILSIVFNNFSMAIELKVMPISTEKYRSTDISGDYAMTARAGGGYGERITEPSEIVPAIKRTRTGTSTLVLARPGVVGELGMCGRSWSRPATACRRGSSDKVGAFAGEDDRRIRAALRGRAP
jgi:thiamine pyrophosphate-dependent acetolactate synthase large subunit-like protein